MTFHKAFTKDNLRHFVTAEMQNHVRSSGFHLRNINDNNMLWFSTQRTACRHRTTLTQACKFKRLMFIDLGFRRLFGRKSLSFFGAFLYLLVMFLVKNGVFFEFLVKDLIYSMVLGPSNKTEPVVSV